MIVKYFYIIVILISLQEVFGRDCTDVGKIVNCNECIRCGGYWCNKPAPNTQRCTSHRSASWCPDDQELLRVIEHKSIPGNKNVSPVYSEISGRIGTPKGITFSYSSTNEQKVNLTITNSTQSLDVSLQTSTECEGEQCVVNVEITPGKEFCSSAGRQSEFVNFKVDLDSFDEDINVKYHVPCACECSQRTEINSSRCNYRGDYSCGVCSCQSGWIGERCEQKHCSGHEGRGDVQCSNPVRTHVECSGNGYCGPCDSCVCFSDQPGSQYFDKDNYCSDICLSISTDCDECLRRPGMPCPHCPTLHLIAYNQTALLSKDFQNRDVWISCNETLPDGCYIEYSAMMEGDEYFFMVTNFCDGTPAAAPAVAAIRITVPVILGIIGLIAATAAAAGYIFWKSRPPPLPLADPRYQNIGAEDCTGENPLYKPPTSSFKNPTYGKW